jgi:hypothetical protein
MERAVIRRGQRTNCQAVDAGRPWRDWHAAAGHMEVRWFLDGGLLEHGFAGEDQTR